MPSATIVVLQDRGVIAVEGPDASKLLQGILTNDVERLSERSSIAAGLLSPQGKILFELIAYRAPGGIFLETAAADATALAKRLGLYKLRADVVIRDVSDAWWAVASWEGAVAWPDGTLGGADPRLAEMGERRLVPVASLASLATTTDRQRYDARRVALGIPEAHRDYVLGDTFPHEADFDLRGGVSFTKGCYVGQEVVARMQHKTVVRKRIVRVRADAPLSEGTDVMAGTFAVGRLGTVAGSDALALLKLDRVDELAAKGHGLVAGDVPLTIDARDRTMLEDMAAARAANR